MTIRILKPISLGTGNARPGEIRDMPRRIARAWIKKGVAEEVADKGAGVDADAESADPKGDAYASESLGAGWHAILKDGVEVEKVRGEAAAKERLQELRDE